MLHFIDRRSYIIIIVVALLVGIVVSIPIVFSIKRNSTGGRLTGQFVHPTGVAIAEEQPLGPIPEQAPHMGRVFPWVGKRGDVVWIQGQHFGANPSVKSLRIGGVDVPKAQIMRWYDSEIQAIIPQDAQQGGVVEVSTGTYPTATSLPFVLYDTDTTMQIVKRGTTLFIHGGTAATKALIWTGDETRPVESQSVSLTPSQEDVFLTDTHGKPLLTVLLYDATGTVLPYYVNPQEFGF